MLMNCINWRFKNASLCHRYDGYGKWFVITPNEMVISVTLYATNVEN